MHGFIGGMTMRSVRTVLALGLVAGSVALAGCGDGDGDDRLASGPAATPASASAGSPTASPPAAESPAADPPPADAAPSISPIEPGTASGPISVSRPANGDIVSRTFTVSGRAAAVEGTLVWELRRRGDVARRGIARGGSMTPAPYSFRVTAPAAGAYQLRVYQESAKDGGPANVVVRDVTVR